jgi:NodT family efflux transporter outer membrane factor (OMF) lipoprotein
MSARRLSVVFALACGAVGCLSSCAVGPAYHKPQAPANAGYSPTPLPESTSSADIHGGDAQHLAMGRDIPFEWWQLFQSPALNALIERAFKNNPTIGAAQAALRQADELTSAQRGFFFPTVTGGYQFERQELAGNLTGSNAPGVQGNGQNLSPYQNASPNASVHNEPLFYNLHTAQVTVGFVPDVFGANQRAVESLAAQAEAQRLTLEATYVTLASNIVAAAIQEASLRAQLAAAREIIDFNEKALRILRAQLDLGYVMRIDVASQESALAQARELLPPLQKQFEQTRDLIRALAGNLPNEDVAETFELDSLQLPRELPVSLPAKIIEQRPDVMAAQAQLHTANAQVGAAVAAMLPQFSITGAAGGVATQFDWLFRSGGPFWSLVGGVSAPIFDGGTLLHRKRAASQALKQAAYQYQMTVIAAYQNVADSLHASVSDADALNAAVEAEKAAKVALDLTRRQLDTGYVNYLTLLNAETAYSQALLNRIQAQASRFGDTVALFQALGGGWWNRTETKAGVNMASVGGAPAQ